MQGTTRRGFMGTLALSLLATSLVTQAGETDFPGSRPIRIVVPTGPGGSTDVLAREFAQHLGTALNATVIVENRGGAGGIIGAQAVASAAPDGFTLLMGTIGVLAINEHLYKDMPYDVRTQFTPVVEVARVTNLLLVNPAVPATTLPEFVAHAKKSGELNYGSSGMGTSPHLAGAMLQHREQIAATHVAYRSGPEAISALMSGDLQFMFYHVTGALPFVRDGRLRALAIAGPQRDDQLPNLPTFAQAGIPDFDVTAWVGLVAPADTPKAVVQRLANAADEVLRREDVRKRYRDLGADAVGGTPEAFGARIQTESDRWGAVIQQAGIRIQ